MPAPIPTRVRTRRRRAALALVAALALAIPVLTHRETPAAPAAPAATGTPCAWWYAIGDRPTDQELVLAAHRYQVVVLNAWETAARDRIKTINPQAQVLVYQDLASLRSYPGAVDGGQDAAQLPAGVGYVEAERTDPAWFATDTTGRRIEWSKAYPGHWQAAVWNPGYQDRWVHNVVQRVTRDRWDGVLADNDLYSLRWYSDAIVTGTPDHAASDDLIRRGAAELVGRAGTALRAAGKDLVPNTSESHLEPGRFRTHSRFTGGMDENFMLRTGDGLLSFQGTVWPELREQAAAGKRLLLMTRQPDGRDGRETRVGWAAAALLDGPAVCWATSSSDRYDQPGWSRYQQLDLGPANGPASQFNGVWTRQFHRGWIALNPGSRARDAYPPDGLVDVDGRPVTGRVQVSAGDAVVLVRRS